MAPPRGDYDEHDRRVRGTEVFVGGLPRSATEGTLREVFSTCGEIVDVRIMKDQNGISKGYGFVRFSKREYANAAKRKKSGFQLQGKKLDVDLSLDQDTLFFGNLHKEWSLEDFEEMIRETFKDVVSVDLAMTSNFGSSNKRHLNRGFAFVRFSSHGAAARVIRIGSRADFLLGGIVHPSINWAEKESSHLDADETDKIKAAFVGNLPANVNEEYLKKLFGRFGKVERVVISRKGQYPVGFVHFARRIELDSAIEEMDGKTVRGPDRGSPFRIQVSVARPAVDNDKKRTREEEKTRRPNISRNYPDYSYERRGHGSHDHQGKAPRLSNAVVDTIDPYESAIISLPPAAKELLLRILRLGIGTQYDIDIHCIKTLNELPESSAVAVLNQFLISGGDKRNKGDYFASLIAKHQALTFGLVHTLHGTYLPRNPEMHSKRFQCDDYDYLTSRSGRYRSSEHYPSSYYADDPPMPEPSIRRYAEERPTPEPRIRQEERDDIRRYQEATFGHEPRHNTGKIYDRRYTQEQNSKIERSPESAILPRERRHGAGYNTDIGQQSR
ncbi:hypothetical protein QOZ80_5AG0395160 [Eleusine coracana subsp. coracana]|nr:hypothetical protein QOZ80_5AG0395160 [Eleusine coracana subsp. coracana]